MMTRLGRITILMLLSVLVLGCQTPSSSSNPQWTAQSIESLDAVAGRWAGILVRDPSARQDDWVRVSIGDDGTYEFASYRTIGVFSGRGQFTLADDKIVSTTEKGTATGTLWAADGRRMLRVVGVTKDGRTYHAELHPSR